jgi:ferredoxin
MPAESAPRWRILVSDDCMSSGQCLMTSPDLFRFNEDGVSEPVYEAVPEDRTEELRRAVDGCPVGAIAIDAVP